MKNKKQKNLEIWIGALKRGLRPWENTKGFPFNHIHWKIFMKGKHDEINTKAKDS